VAFFVTDLFYLIFFPDDLDKQPPQTQSSMPNFFSQIFRRSHSSSSTRDASFRSSKSSIDNSFSKQRGPSSANIRTATSEGHIPLYTIDLKQLEKNKLHKASWNGDIDKVTRLAQPNVINLQDQHQRVMINSILIVHLMITAMFSAPYG
jgi:hypothetical protein